MHFENRIKNSPDYSLCFIHNSFLNTHNEYFLVIDDSTRLFVNFIIVLIWNYYLFFIYQYGFNIFRSHI